MVSTTTEQAAKSRPILFKGPLVRAILAGQKSATRRVVKPQPPIGCVYAINGNYSHALCLGEEGLGTARQVYVPPTPTSTDHRLPCPYGRPGDTLWVRECWAYRVASSPEERQVVYRASVEDPPDWPSRRGAYSDFCVWRPSIHMPRWASRITLRVTDVRVERLGDITEADAVAEGFTPLPDFPPREQFAFVWDVINKRRPGCSWADSPWVWVISFERVTP